MAHLPLLMHSHLISLQEVPDEISLTIGLYDCPFGCEDCHTPELQSSGLEEGDSKTALTKEYLGELIEASTGITVVTFFGGDNHPTALIELLVEVHSRGLKTCVYTGASHLSPKITDHLDFYKVGKYIPEYGPLTSEKTNQTFRKRTYEGFADITHYFWRPTNANQ